MLGTSKEKGLFLAENKWDMNQQCLAVMKANCLLDCIGKTVEEVIKGNGFLFPTLTRLHMGTVSSCGTASTTW